MAFLDKLKKVAEDVGGKVGVVADELVDTTKKFWDENSDFINKVAEEATDGLNDMASKVEETVKSSGEKKD